jgi:uncharacterized protein (TIGR00290 family)
MPERLLLSWSGGKDCALALREIAGDHGTEVAALLTVVTAGYDRISMHGVRRDLLQKQAESLGYPLEVVLIPQQCTDEQYGEAMRRSLESYRSMGVDRVAFGDLFLEDVRRYREERLAQVGMRALFPLWGRDTALQAREFVSAGFRAVVVCVDTNVLDGRFAGRDYDMQFISDLPPGIDPCGENGEFHTFVYDGPIFGRKVEFRRGEIVLRDERFRYCDLTPSE